MNKEKKIDNDNKSILRHNVQMFYYVLVHCETKTTEWSVFAKDFSSSGSCFYKTWTEIISAWKCLHEFVIQQPCPYRQAMKVDVTDENSEESWDQCQISTLSYPY